MISDKYVVVTGASGYLGTAICKEVEKKGFRLLAIGRSDSKLKTLNDSLSKEDHIYLAGDCTKENLIDALSEIVITEKINIYGIIAHACPTVKRLDNFDGMEISRQVERIVSAYTNIVEWGIPHMKVNRAGSIILTGSLWSTVAFQNSVYLDLGNNPSVAVAIAKAGIVQYTKCLAVSLAPHNISVNCISPGWFPKPSGPARADYIAEITKRTPMGRIGKPKDIASIYADFLAESYGFVTGQHLTVDGGYTSV